MKSKQIEFDPEELVRAVESFADHLQGKRKLTLRSKVLPVPRTVGEITPRDIVKLRKKLALSQALFARILNVPKVTAISWERGRRKPTGAALRLLDLVRRNPGIVNDICIDSPRVKKAA